MFSRPKEDYQKEKKIAKTITEGITELNAVLCLCVGAVGSSPDDTSQ